MSCESGSGSGSGREATGSIAIGGIEIGVLAGEDAAGMIGIMMMVMVKGGAAEKSRTRGRCLFPSLHRELTRMMCTICFRQQGVCETFAL